MNTDVVKNLEQQLNINEKRINSVLELLAEGATVPFIARYRKEVTGGLDEEQIRIINESYEYESNLLKRKEDVIRLIDEKGMLTDELKQSINACKKLIEVEDLYRPFKEKKKTKATEAIKNGLEPLAKLIQSFDDNVDELAKDYLNDVIKTKEDAITGAKYIIAENISDNAKYRKDIRLYIYQYGLITSKIKPKAIDEKKIYEIYYEFAINVNKIKPHQILATNRGEKEKILTVGITVNKDEIIENIKKNEIKDKKGICATYIEEAIEDSYKRLIFPSVEREVRSELKEVAEVKAIENFASNVENLLLSPPMKEKIVLGFDPAFRTGCKLAVLGKTGQLLETEVIYPHEPQNKFEESKTILLNLIDKYNIDIIAIGNGTASRESEIFVSQVLKEASKETSYLIINEAGASVYSASKNAIAEFPDLTVEKRSAISIGRRLQDTLSELVKIDPKSIGVGLYQHDVNAKRLDESLDFVVSKVVNQVGVNINTASSELLSYVSGLNKRTIKNIVDSRNKLGKYNSREEIKNIKGITDLVYEQSIGFLRIPDGTNPLDKTGVHPESYNATNKLIKDINFNLSSIGTKEMQEALDNINIKAKAKGLNIDEYTLKDIILDLKKPNRDPRDNMSTPILKSDILDIQDLKIGSKLQGTVRNVVDFGAFIDIGLHNDGLVHISKMANRFIKHPSEIVKVGDIVECYVIDIDLDKEKVSLSLLELTN